MRSSRSWKAVASCVTARWSTTAFIRSSRCFSNEVAPLSAPVDSVIGRPFLMTDHARLLSFRRALQVLALLLVIAGPVAVRAAAQSGGVSYLYDGAGRLIGVVDP